MSVIKRGGNDITDRYRPRRFQEVIGNEQIINAMKNILAEGETRNKVYMYMGSPGSCKTTMARIMAMALNCEKGDADPCLECESCKSAMGGHAMHITELNLSLLNKKEDADDIVGSMHIRPLTGRNKVYIFDEAQLLTTASQNTLLKNVEEPPPNTYIFICTTDPKKIIDALRSRCQKYEFKYPSKAEISELLQSVMKQEKWSMSDEDKKIFFEYCQGMSFREILKCIDQAVKGGVSTIVNLTFEKAEYKEVCQYLLKGDFRAICEVLKILKDNNQFEPEALRHVILGWLKSCLIREGFSEKGNKIAESMGEFLTPYFEVKPENRLYYNLYRACLMLR